MDLEEIARMVASGGAKSDPKVATVEAQVRTGIMFPLPDWIDTPVEHPGPQPKKRPE